MCLFSILHVTIGEVGARRMLVRAVVANRRTGRTLAVSEWLQNGRMQLSIFSAFRQTPFAAALEDFLLADTEERSDSSLSRARRDWRVRQRYIDMMIRIERALPAVVSSASLRQRARLT
jgi:hypothetical protein